MSKFTPGPWEYLSEIEYCHDHPFSQAHRVKIGQETLTISCHGVDWDGEPMAKANACLIAAAPDLYEALKWVTDVWAYTWSDKQMKKALAALKKARGER